ASGMTAEIRGMGQAVRNANDGISFAQTAEGALNEVTNMLQRVRELAVQSKSGTYSSTDRTNLDAESKQLQAQVADILQNTKFNGVQVFDYGTATTSDAITIQAGSAATATVDIEKAFFNSGNFEAADFAVDTVSNANATIGTMDTNL